MSDWWPMLVPAVILSWMIWSWMGEQRKRRKVQKAMADKLRDYLARLKRRGGNAMIEYTLLLGFILFVLISVVAAVGDGIGGIWNKVHAATSTTDSNSRHHDQDSHHDREER
jgi:Flp pilus assembly pilin Flp